LKSAQSASTETRDDAILPATRLVAAGVIPFLLAAFLILYLRPEETARRFAWEIASPLTCALMGAGYLGGAFFFARVLGERRWHRVGGGFPSVAVFTAVLLAATLLHWDTFDPRHWPFLVWLVIYIVTPVVVPLVWLLNRRRDPGEPEPDDLLVSPAIGRVLLAVGVLLLLSAVYLFLLPASAADLWPWPLTPLTARVLAGWQALLGVGALALGRERRWSGWIIPLQSILVWQALLLLAFFLRRDSFGPEGPLNWFTLYTLFGVLVAAALYLIMERRRGSDRQ
jgi:hypothetical protein